MPRAWPAPSSPPPGAPWWWPHTVSGAGAPIAVAPVTAGSLPAVTRVRTIFDSYVRYTPITGKRAS